jgi:hypothetical protein
VTLQGRRLDPQPFLIALAAQPQPQAQAKPQPLPAQAAQLLLDGPHGGEDGGPRPRPGAALTGAGTGSVAEGDLAATACADAASRPGALGHDARLAAAQPATRADAQGEPTPDAAAAEAEAAAAGGGASSQRLAAGLAGGPVGSEGRVEPGPGEICSGPDDWGRDER